MPASGTPKGSRTGASSRPLRGADSRAMPSVLAEIAFLSNPKDEAQLKASEYRQKVAEALFKGVSQYAATLSSFPVARGKGGRAAVRHRRQARRRYYT